MESNGTENVDVERKNNNIDRMTNSLIELHYDKPLDYYWRMKMDEKEKIVKELNFLSREFLLRSLVFLFFRVHPVYSSLCGSGKNKID